jgi:hypothetical protein
MTTLEYLKRVVDEQIKLTGNPYEDYRAEHLGIKEWKEFKITGKKKMIKEIKRGVNENGK